MLAPLSLEIYCRNHQHWIATCYRSAAAAWGNDVVIWLEIPADTRLADPPRLVQWLSTAEARCKILRQWNDTALFRFLGSIPRDAFGCVLVREDGKYIGVTLECPEADFEPVAGYCAVVLD